MMPFGDNGETIAAAYDQGFAAGYAKAVRELEHVRLALAGHAQALLGAGAQLVGELDALIVKRHHD